MESNPAERLLSGSSMTFPSLAEKTSPESNATVSTALTYSDKLSALPSSTPNPNRQRSPIMSSHSQGQPIPIYRRSLDGVSHPALGNNFDSFSKISPEVGGTWNGGRPKASVSEGSLNHEVLDAYPGRASMDSDRTSLPTMQSVRQVVHNPALHRIRRGSDPSAPYATSPRHHTSTVKSDHLLVGSRSPSHSRSRAASPLRILHQWSQGMHHRSNTGHFEEPFIPINPFQSQFRFSLPMRLPLPSWLRNLVSNNSCPEDAEGLPMKTTTHLPTAIPISINYQTNTPDAIDGHVHSAEHNHRMDLRMLHIFFLDTLPRMVYLHLLLRIPSMYFSRVARIFEDAEVSKPDIQRMIDACGRAGSQLRQGHRQNRDTGDNSNAPVTYLARNTTTAGVNPSSAPNLTAAAASMVDLTLPLPLPEEWSADSSVVSPALVRFKLSWEGFIDSLMREWKTLNVVSALLLSAILTMFQINDAATDPLTRTAALLSLICATMSLSYGCIYIVRFTTMRSMYRASIWAEEAQKTKTLVWWNVWVLLGMPAVFMAWSMILFIVSILSFVWRTGTESDPDERPPLSDKQALGPRIAITLLFLLGMVYFVLIVVTLKSYSVSSRWRGREMINVVSRHPRTHENGTERRRAVDTNTAKDRRNDRESGARELGAQAGVGDVMRGRERDRGVQVGLGLNDGDLSLQQQLSFSGSGFGWGVTGVGTDSGVDIEKGAMSGD
ncbi:hypothetical protein D9757_003010 [Collybiopsis confluens]|uniref:Uncharacterized protein n=1 Tax=Collybiopsis confluens TaxID=2823264 RepID=A0A8H5HXG9_9AGAR|nr:hypothetical protein D9757_003010 [Collybiopsis confluens]